MNIWWYISNDKQEGPVDTDQLHYLLRAGTITARSLLWKSGMKDWQPAAQIDELALLLRSLPGGNSIGAAELAGARRLAQRYPGSSIALVVGCLAVILGLSMLALTPNLPMTKHEREEETKRDLEYRLRCQPSEYKDFSGCDPFKICASRLRGTPVELRSPPSLWLAQDA